MSSGGSFGLCIRSIAELINAISDLNIAYKKIEEMRTTDGKIHKVDVVVKDENNRSIGFAKQKDGTYKIIADSAGLNAQQLAKQKKFVNKIRRRYAYNKILRELKDEGYEVVEEKEVKKDTISLVARRWVS